MLYYAPTEIIMFSLLLSNYLICVARPIEGVICERIYFCQVNCAKIIIPGKMRNYYPL